MRNEKEIFADLRALCTSPGYAHAIAFLCFRDNIVPYKEEITAEDILHLYSNSCLIRTEISTLIGLMIQEDISYAWPTPDALQECIEQTEALLEEMHKVIGEAFSKNFNPEKIADPDFNPFTRGDVLREPIFYGGESAYSFQYRDFSTKKYTTDDEWLKSNKGFSIQTARDVVYAIGKIQEQKLSFVLQESHNNPSAEWTPLPGYTFSAKDVAEVSGIEDSTVEAVLSAFAMSLDERNQSFSKLNDFNVANAMPFLRTSDGDFILFQAYSLVEALYESPYYWMVVDREYRATAMMNRGRFTEAFCQKRLELVFGSDNVHVNVKVFELKKEIGEIDVLVFFGNRAIVLQAKSKQLTLEARKGNDGQIQGDFEKSVQGSYDQGLACSKQLSESNVKLVDVNSQVIEVPNKISEIYILCAVSDHYPALSLQTRQFLTYETTDQIQPPLVLDIFALDTITEMLQSPLHFLSYLNRRVKYSDKLIASHELTILSYHLKKNLWINHELDMIALDDSIVADLDVAMMVRRDGIQGKETPDGILTRHKSTALGRIMTEIEANPNPGTIDLGFMLLTFNEETFIGLSKGIDKIAQLARQDQQSHELILGFDSPSAGLTIHCNEEPMSVSVPRLLNHCKLSKYAQKAKRWFGICLHPHTKTLRFGLSSDQKWQQSVEMDMVEMDMRVKDMPHHINFADALKSLEHKRKIGRNAPCPCGSGKKFKKCCGR